MRIAHTLVALFCLQTFLIAQGRSQVPGKLIFERRLPISAIREKPVVLGPTHSIVFPEEDRIAVAYVSHERTGLTTRQESAYAFRVLMLDHLGGQVAEGAFSTEAASDRALCAGGAGKLVLLTNGRLELLSTALKSEKSQPLSDGSKRMLSILPSGDHRTVLTLNHAPTGMIADLWNAKSLEKISSCTLHGSWPDSLIDEVEAGLAPASPADPQTHEVVVGRVCGGRKVIYHWSGDPEFPTLITANLIVLAGGYSRFQVIRNEEGVVKEERFGKQDFVDSEIRRSEDGAIFAVAIKKFSGGSSFFDISPHLSSLRIVVFRTEGFSKVADIRVSRTPKHRFDFALSPKGSKIAILADDYLQVFSL